MQVIYFAVIYVVPLKMAEREADLLPHPASISMCSYCSVLRKFDTTLQILLSSILEKAVINPFLVFIQ